MIITSILDNDFYKFTMMHAVGVLYPEAEVVYRFINRGNDRFTEEFLEKLKIRVKELEKLALTDEEYTWLEGLNVFPKQYLDKLRAFRYNTNAVTCKLDDSNNLLLDVTGNWFDTILLEVPLLALISETYFENTPYDEADTLARTHMKAEKLSEADCDFIDFGTRRRRSRDLHEKIVRVFTEYDRGYKGSSNVDLSRKFNTMPSGTMAHEWIMGHAGMFGVPGSNKKSFEAWLDVYQGDFSVALTDTYTTETFFEEFKGDLAKKYSGIRQDSGDPLKFVDDALAFFKQEHIDASTKKVVFSDTLTWDRAIEIEEYIAGRFQPIYGIGTHFTNDVPGSPALNMVIKLAKINGTPVFKTTDSASKECFVKK